MSLRISSYVTLEHPALPWRKKHILSSMQGNGSTTSTPDPVPEACSKIVNFEARQEGVH